MGTLLGDVGVHAHRCSADTAIAVVLFPVEQFLALAGFKIVFFRQFEETLAQRTHLVATVVGDGLVDAVSLMTVDMHHDRPGLQLGGRFQGYTITLGGLFKYNV
jgi:hypothetical protein